MFITFFTNRLNHHQAPVADALFRLTNGEFRFVEVCAPTSQSNKGDTTDYSTRPYLLRAWESIELREEAMRLSEESDVAVFGANSLRYEVNRSKKTNLISFEMSERWLKRGIINILSPRFLKYQWYYHTLFHKRPVYKLCSGAYCARDQYLFHSFVGRCYKWGYFPEIADSQETLRDVKESSTIRLMWCARFLRLKHPELVIRLAERLKKNSISFVLDMYGDGGIRTSCEQLVTKLDLHDRVFFHGEVPHTQVLGAMMDHDILVFTSNQREGWGAVVNEAMSQGCVVVANEKIGCVPFLISHHNTGCIYSNNDLDSLEQEVLWLINSRDKLNEIRIRAKELYSRLWTPQHAAESLLQLIGDLMGNQVPSILDGPCSSALPI